MSNITIHAVDRLELILAPQPWLFAEQNRAEIDHYFRELQRKKPALWNGRVLLLREYILDGGLFRGSYLETDFASFTAWRHWDYPPAGVYDCFGAAAILSRDGAFLLGIMGEHTVNAGQIYFPCGTPDMSDVQGERIDLEASVARELKEETGCDIAEFIIDAGWTMVKAGGLIMLVKLLRSLEPAENLRKRICAHLKREKQPELSNIRLIYSEADFDSAMPCFVKAFLERFFAIARCD